MSKLCYSRKPVSASVWHCAGAALALLISVTLPARSTAQVAPRAPQSFAQFRLHHVKPDDIISILTGLGPPFRLEKLFSRSGPIPELEVLPGGLSRAGGDRPDGWLMIRGHAEELFQLVHAIRIIDVPQEPVAGGNIRVRLSPESFRPRQFRALLPEFPDQGTVTAQGQDLILEGAPAWVRRALWHVAHYELPDPTQPPGVREELLHVSRYHLRHLDAEVLLNLLFEQKSGDQKRLQDFTSRATGENRVVPDGITGAGNANTDNAIVIRGETAAIEQLRNAIAVVDVPAVSTESGSLRMVIQPRRVKLDRLRNLLAGLPGDGTVTADERELTLDGPPRWVRQMLRATLKYELHPPDGEVPAAAPEPVAARLKLTHLEPGDAVNVLCFPDRAMGEDLNSSGPADRKGALPDGISGLRSYPQDHSLVVRGDAPSIRKVTELLQVVDVPLARQAGGKVRVVVRPRAFPPDQFEALLPRWPDPGTISVEGPDLVLIGSRPWVVRTLSWVAKFEAYPARARRTDAR